MLKCCSSGLFELPFISKTLLKTVMTIQRKLGNLLNLLSNREKVVTLIMLCHKPVSHLMAKLMLRML